MSTFPAYEGSLEPHTKFWLTFTGQIMIAIGHPFLITMSTKISQGWFPEEERILSTAAMACASAFGGMLGSVLAPLIVRKDKTNIPILNTVLPSLAVLGFLLTWLSVNSKYPPTPPSPSAERVMQKQSDTLGNLHQTLIILSNINCLYFDGTACEG